MNPRELLQRTCASATPSLRLHSLWTWLPVLGLFRGLVFTFLFAFSLVMLRRLGLHVRAVTFFLGWLLVPYILKPFVRPWMRKLGSSRFFLFEMELLIVLSVGGIGFSLQEPNWKMECMVFYFALALWGALHDIVASNFCMAALGPRCSRLVSKVNFYTLIVALLGGLGVLVMVGGNMEVLSRAIRSSWMHVCYIASAVCLVLLVAQLFLLPYPREAGIMAQPQMKSLFDRFVDKCAVIAKSPKAWPWIMFLLLYLLPLSLLWPMTTLFLIDPRSSGGMGLSPQEVAYVQGTLGVLSLIGGCVLSEYLLRRYPSGKMWLLLALLFTLPAGGWLWLSFVHPSGLSSIAAVVIAQGFGTGMGIAPYRLSVFPPPGSHRILSPQASRSLMGIAVMLPFTASGNMQAALGYRRFFFLVVLSCGVSLAVILLLLISRHRWRRRSE